MAIFELGIFIATLKCKVKLAGWANFWAVYKIATPYHTYGWFYRTIKAERALKLRNTYLYCHFEIVYQNWLGRFS